MPQIGSGTPARSRASNRPSWAFSSVQLLPLMDWWAPVQPTAHHTHSPGSKEAPEEEYLCPSTNRPSCVHLSVFLSCDDRAGTIKTRTAIWAQDFRGLTPQLWVLLLWGLWQGIDSAMAGNKSGAKGLTSWGQGNKDINGKWPFEEHNPKDLTFSH